nr:hypothetical membrane protein [uncultured archaeon]
MRVDNSSIQYLPTFTNNYWVFSHLLYVSWFHGVPPPFYFLITDSFSLYIKDVATPGHIIKWKNYLSTHISQLMTSTILSAIFTGSFTASLFAFAFFPRSVFGGYSLGGVNTSSTYSSTGISFTCSATFVRCLPASFPGYNS